MRIVCLSDTHLMHRKIDVPDGDVLLHAGDILLSGDEVDGLADFNRWLGDLPHRHKIVVAGNHDWVFADAPDTARALLTNATYLQDSEARASGLRVWGSPWQPEFMDWAFNLPRGEPLREKWDLIPGGLDILVTHGPPWGVLDQNVGGRKVGCEELAKAVGRVPPRLHLFGHIHEAYGTLRLGDTIYVNASICDAAYRPVHPPVVVDL